MKIEWSDDALADLDRFATFLRETYPALAERVARELVSKAQMLSELPRSGGSPRIPAGRLAGSQCALRVPVSLCRGSARDPSHLSRARSTTVIKLNFLSTRDRTALQCPAVFAFATVIGVAL
jgi:ParE toxin of type II toxin-antitoxin system, parDE